MIHWEVQLAERAVWSFIRSHLGVPTTRLVVETDSHLPTSPQGGADCSGSIGGATPVARQASRPTLCQPDTKFSLQDGPASVTVLSGSPAAILERTNISVFSIVYITLDRSTHCIMASMARCAPVAVLLADSGHWSSFSHCHSHCHCPSHT